MLRKVTVLLLVFCWSAGATNLAFALADPPTAKSPPQIIDELRRELYELVDKTLEVRLANEIDYVHDTPNDIAQKLASIRQAGRDIQAFSIRGVYDPSVHALDVVRIKNDASPRLTGRIFRVGPEEEFKTLDIAIPMMLDGDMVALGEGEHHLSETFTKHPFEWKSIAFVGKGIEETSLRIHDVGRYSTSFRFEDLTIDCNRSVFLRLGPGGGAYFDSVRIVNYNAGWSGSKSIAGRVFSMFANQTYWDGSADEDVDRKLPAGSAINSGSNSDAIWLRHCQLVDNMQLVQSFGIVVLDGCVSMNQLLHPIGVAGHAHVRESNVDFKDASSTLFTLASDDIAFIQYAINGEGDVDQQTKDIIQKLDLDRAIPYWIGLVRHEDSAVRAIALDKIEAMTGQTIDNRQEVIDANSDLRLDQPGSLLVAEVAFTKLMNWFDRNKEKLEYDTATKTFSINEPATDGIQPR